ncbi:MAG: TlyA family RNA methyltransferase [Asticcacaulis sp.]
MPTRLDQALVALGLADSRTRAQAAIREGKVTVDGQVCLKPGHLVSESAVLTAEPVFDWVGRGALKLDHALNLWPVPVTGGVFVDVGASTGGFTEVLLARGASRVYAVDVGRDQLHPRLRADPRVVSLEGCDARTLSLEQIPEPLDGVVCDASFISLTKLLAPALSLARPGAVLVALIKPQFELSPDKIGKGGLVRDPADFARAVERVQAAVIDWGWHVRALEKSPISGGDGAVEWLLWGIKAGEEGSAQIRDPD